jgi:putative membrane protein
VPVDPTAAAAPSRPTASLWTLRTAAALAAGGVLLQIGYVLVSDEPRRLATLASVVAFAVAGVVHAVAVRGLRWGLAMALTVAGLALLVEAVGTATGFPFGAYSYTGTLGVQVAGVPLLIPLAWLWMAYPSFLAGQALGGRRWGWLAGAWTLATWDLFVDPQMVDAGYWTWDHPTPALPGIPGIPLTNYAGWLGTAILMMLVIRLISHVVGRAQPLPDPGRLPADLIPAAVLVWTYLSSVLANAVFLGRPAAAAWLAVLMGVTVLPYLRMLVGDLLSAARSDARSDVPSDAPSDATRA